MPDTQVWWLGDVVVSAASQVGSTRALNEDALAVSEALGLVLVVDGTGNIQGASSGGLARDALVAHLGRAAGTDEARLAWSFAKASHAVTAMGEATPAHRGLGAAAVAVLVRPDGAVLAHVGDCRAYRARDGRLTTLTRDHDLIRQADEQGYPGQVPDHFRNVITRALGFPGQPDVTRVAMQTGDRLLLCSDGVHRAIAPAELQRLALSPDPVPAILAAAAAGGDDATVAIVDWRPPR